MKRKFIAVGHIVNDTEPFNHLGGGVSYSTVASSRLGHPSYIITKCPENHPYINQLSNLGVTVYRLPSQLNTITTFRNFYDEFGRRKQVCPEKQEMIASKDTKSIPQDLLKDAIILVATVIGEVSTNTFSELSSKGILTITPQGYFRDTKSDRTIIQKKWEGFESDLSFASVTVLSEEDITINGTFDNDLLNKIKERSKITVLTTGEQGSIIYEDGKEKFKSSIFPLQENEIKDFTGAGDSFATAFITKYMESNNIQEAAVFASFYAALKIMAVNGIGLDSIPKVKQIKDFISANKDRVEKFLAANNCPNLQLI